MIDNYSSLGDDKIEVRYAHIPREKHFAEKVYSAANALFPPISDYFAISSDFPKIRIILVIDRGEYDRLVREFLRVPIQAPSHPGRIAQPQRTDMVVLSPSAYQKHSIYVYVPDDFRRLIAHELTHMAHEYLSPDMEATPTWWGEGLAIYLSDQWRFEGDFRKPPLHGVAIGMIPKMSEIQASRKLAYQWGWTLVRFLDFTCGREAIVRVVRECADGNVLSVIGQDVDTFETQWMDWLTSGGLSAGTNTNAVHTDVDTAALVCKVSSPLHDVAAGFHLPIDG